MGLIQKKAPACFDKTAVAFSDPLNFNLSITTDDGTTVIGGGQVDAYSGQVKNVSAGPV